MFVIEMDGKGFESYDAYDSCCQGYKGSGDIKKCFAIITPRNFEYRTFEARKRSKEWGEERRE